MSAVCKDCNQPMVGNGCTYDLIHNKGEEWHKRSLEHWCDPGQNCGDCGAPYGKIHHFGCDVERCPVCQLQLISCECWGPRCELGKSATMAKSA
jgi:hypothetical protein